MKNIYIKQTVVFIPGQRGGEIAPDDTNGACPHCSGDLNFDPFDTDYEEAGPLVCSHCDGKTTRGAHPEAPTGMDSFNRCGQ